MDAEIKEYEQQLDQVREALTADPNNEELKTLQGELENLISLTRSLAAQQGTSAAATTTSRASNEPVSASSASKRGRTDGHATGSQDRGAAPVSEAVVRLAAGDECMAKYAALFRTQSTRSSSRYKGATETLRSGAVRPSNNSASGAAKGSAATGGHSSATRGSPLFTAEEEAERDRKRKRSEKKTERHEIKTKTANEKADTWQKFAKKGAKKGYGIPSGSKGSMFKTPDDPLAKVGVVGAGRGMTSYSDRTKHVYEEGGSSNGR